MKEENVALLIDAENISPRYVKTIMKEVKKYGVITYKRIYRDWTCDSAVGWKDVILEYGLAPVQQYSYTTGKNATDFAIIIDAMDILYTQSIDVFCLATSDSDFTKLATRLKESGRKVVGMGEHKVPKSFPVCCDTYVYLDEEKTVVPKKTDGKRKDKRQDKKIEKATEKMPDHKVIPKEELVQYIKALLLEYERKQKTVCLGQLGSLVKKRYPSFVPKDYKCKTFMQFIEYCGIFVIQKKNQSVCYKRS